jgi:ribosomal protein L24E
MPLSESAVEALPVPEQLFIVINEERVDRGLAPIQYLTAQLDSYALQGANAQTDPSFPTALSGGAPLTWGGAIWAGGISSALEADYYWMYDDGWGGSAAATTDAPCTSATSAGCWGHRDVILHAFSSCAGGAAPTLSMGAASSPTGGGSLAALMVSTCAGAPPDVTMSWSQLSTQGIVAQKVVSLAALPSGTGYWAAASDGAVSAFGSAANLGSMAGQSLNSPIVALAATPDGRGYWLVASDGGIFSFGDAKFYGSTGNLVLHKPIVGMAATPDGAGYWLVASDGGIFSFGDAKFSGSMGAKALNQPIVGMSVDQATGGYWLVASDGGIFSFNAPFFGSTGALRLNKPIVGMEALGNGEGYRFVASDGGVFCFGQAAFDGSAGGQTLAAPVSSMAPDQATGGYWLAGTSGIVYNFGGAASF